MAWPAGFKLNGNLVRFLGSIFIWLISIWRRVIALAVEEGEALGGAQGAAAIALQGLLIAIGAFGGLSTLLAVAIDGISIATTHVRLFHYVAARMFANEWYIMTSLFHLFRGKRWNVLRRRMDSALYEVDQLLLGTVLFSAVVFAFPTIAFYYGLFLANVTLWASLWLLLSTAHLFMCDASACRLLLLLAAGRPPSLPPRRGPAVRLALLEGRATGKESAAAPGRLALCLSFERSIASHFAPLLAALSSHLEVGVLGQGAKFTECFLGSYRRHQHVMGGQRGTDQR